MHSNTHCCLCSNSLALSSISKNEGTAYRNPSHERFLEGCSSPFVRLAEHLMAPRTWCKAMSAWLVKTRRAPSRHGRDARIYGHTTTAMHKLSNSPLPPPPLLPRPVASAAVAAAAAAALAAAAAAARLSRRPGHVKMNRLASRNGGHATSSHTPPKASSSAAFGPWRG